MALQFAGVDTDIMPPRLLGKPYKYVSFKVGETDISETHLAHMIERAKDAWKALQHRANMGTCNNYFAGLPRGLTLRQVIDEGPIVLWLLKSTDPHKKLTLASATGRDIAVNSRLLLKDDRLEIVCTLVHELAHTAGASTNNDKRSGDPHMLDAEQALKKCACFSKYDEGNLGWHIRNNQTALRRIV